jgi:hypothetical protein
MDDSASVERERADESAVIDGDGEWQGCCYYYYYDYICNWCNDRNSRRQEKAMIQKGFCNIYTSEPSRGTCCATDDQVAT